MVTKLGRSTPGFRKLHLLQALAGSKSVKRSSIILDALLYIQQLKLKLQELQREYLNLLAIKNEYLTLMKHTQIPKEVKVEKTQEGLLVRVTCRKGGDLLVSILEAFDEMGLNVIQARVSCTNFFAMEAIAVAQDKEAVDARDVSQAVLKAIERGDGEGEL
ncbi:hypothetical protein SLEP1_g6122 [Rubroshorea leprosula]|uniref:Plant bHLH transcription factor ACT-like domain-containing protein n=1 Tax=Rubroshorea leprosula TaxID=152421 RepID=A0AAV5HUH4_9ROSI|nr:hypothetical protein SLEP1_g6122 [Rubroshorea leprosula]